MKAGNRIARVVATSALFALSVANLPGQADQAAQRTKVLIGFTQTPGASEEALVQAFGGVVSHTYHLIPAIAAEVPQAALNGLQNHPLVTVVEADVKVYEVDAELDTSWGVKHIGAGTVHQANTGIGAKVCVIDSGIDVNHPDLWPPAAGSWDFVEGDSDPTDGRGHGTHVAGSLGAMDNDSGVVGVAPNAEIIALRILDNNGSGDFSDAIAAVERCVDFDGHVTNNSYGSSQNPGTLVQAAFDNAYAAGVLHVAASGNATFFRCNKVGFPAAYESVIAVGATNSSDSLASWSCKGAEQELAAPGVSIYSTAPTEGCTLCGSNTSGYLTLSGTSMASPHVAGVAALVHSCGVTGPDAIRQRLISTAVDLGSAGRDSNYGYGLVDAVAATSDCGPVDNPPNVTITNPVDNSTVSESVVITADASDDVDVVDVEFSVDGSSLGLGVEGPDGVWSWDSWDVSGLAEGSSHSVSATATDTASQTTTASVTVIVDNVDDPPSIVIVSPSEGATVSGAFAVVADADDDRGVSQVEFFVDGSSIGIDNDGSDGWSVDWDTTALPDGGNPSLTATATDSGSLETSDSISVFVDNSVPQVSLTVTGYKERGLQKADLTWSGATSTNVDVYRDGALILTIANEGDHTDNIDNRGGGSYNYEVCEAGTTVCSNSATVTF